MTAPLPRAHWKIARRIAVVLLAAVACGGERIRDPAEGTIEFMPNRPNGGGASATASPYLGSDPLVVEATQRYITGLDLHQKLVMRSCGPVNGVCHNVKEYPDLHTPAAFGSIVGAPCNVQPGSYITVFDRCEPVGDRFKFLDSTFGENEIGWFQVILGDAPDVPDNALPAEDAPGLHLHLHDPVPGTRVDLYDTGTFIRTFVDGAGQVQELPFVSYRSEWFVYPDRTHVIALVQDYQQDDLVAIVKGGVSQGDMNRNGVFGHRTGRSVTLISPGKPEESYFVARLRGQMQGETVLGSRMPLANQPPSIPDMVALMCFIQGLDPAHEPNLENPIDYGRCGYTADAGSLNLVGNGVTFSGRIQPLLQATCGGCHGGVTPQAGLDLASEGLRDRLLLASKQQPARKLIVPGSPENSYLWLKLSGDGSVSGSRMPIDPLAGGVRPLDAQSLSDLETWIIAGALND